MNVAIIGGGAAGMTTAFLLDKYFDVTVFEREQILGGNIRTLNKNVTSISLNKNLILDNGVIEFERNYFPNFHKLLKHLDVGLAPVKLSSEIFLADGTYIKSGAGIIVGCRNNRERIREASKLLTVMGGYLNFFIRICLSQTKSFYDKPVSDYLSRGTHSIWLKMLLMYAYSIPYVKIKNFPAEIAMPLLRHSGMFTKWDRIVGGVYTYIEKMISKIKGSIVCSSNIKEVNRAKSGVEITMSSGDKLKFDKVVFACTPDQVLSLLGDPSDAEIKWFHEWRINEITTLIHTDTSIYKHFGVTYFSEFDVFQKDTEGNCGYNAYLDRLCDVNPNEYSHYSLAYNLTDKIDPEKIIHSQKHVTPDYTVSAVRYRPEIIERNGENNTFHAGAYLYDGLHEGAITSAFKVSELLGGLKIGR